MRVVSAPARLRVLPAAIVAAHARAAETLAAAREEAREIVARARAEADAIRAEAQRAGEQAGSAAAAALVLRVEAERAAQAERDGASVAELALEVARAVLGREAASGPEVVRDVVRQALGRVRRARRVVLRVHPDELAAVRASARAWLPAGLDPELLAVEADPVVGRGGAVVETDLGKIDARLETQLDALARALAGG